jgi:hypothetical protein
LASITVDSTLLSALISAVVAFIIVTADRFFFEARTWHKRYEIRWLEKQIQIHEWLLTILNACREKAKRQAEKSTNRPPHLLESADIGKLENIFEKNAYLLGDSLRKTWLALQGRDQYFELARVRNRDVDVVPPLETPQGPMQFPPTKHEAVFDDLTEMEKQAETDLACLRLRYRKLTGFAV